MSRDEIWYGVKETEGNGEVAARKFACYGDCDTAVTLTLPPLVEKVRLLTSRNFDKNLKLESDEIKVN